ncbi:MAG TPA: glycosyltransferase family A protein [Gemmataceae bacterium]|jgi:glycosyltransferase involved in cell wall biosynthesis
MAAQPLVSVTLLAYNHGKYIDQAIRSVLQQTHTDLEVVVVNDGSTDETAEILNRQTDPRVRVFHQTNQGPSMAANRALSECRGKYLAIMAGDDLLPLDRIAKQLAHYRKVGRCILFSNVEFIDEDNKLTDTDYYISNLTPANGRARVLRRLFDGNAPAFILTLFTEMQILKAEPLYCDPALYQLQDYDLMVRLAKKYDFAYQDDKLYRFRLRTGHVNLSGPDPEKLIRTTNELYLIMRSFFDGISSELFKEIFPDRVRNPNFQTPLEYLCEQAFVLLKAPTTPLRLLGAERLYDLLRQEQARAVLKQQYNFTHVSFADTIKLIDTEKRFNQTQLYLDVGKGYSEEARVCRPANLESRLFSFRFDLSKASSLQAVRWDPLEGAYCQVWLDSAGWEDSQGRKWPIDVNQLTSNGVATSDGSFLFGTKDPMIIFPVKGPAAALTLQGRWELNDACDPVRFRMSKLWPDDGCGRGEDRAITRNVYLGDNDFELTFNTSTFKSVKIVRWNPVECCLCKVHLHSVTYSDVTGTQHTLDLTKVKSNGTQLTDGAHLFDTHNPMFLFAVDNEIASITVRGHWWGPLSQTDVQYSKLLEDMSTPSRLAYWIVRRGVRKLGKFRPGKRAASYE